VAVVWVPGPQIFFSVPKSPGLALAVLEAEALVAELGVLLPPPLDERPQAARPRVSTAPIAMDVRAR
jgi:hypothetical protein